MEIMLAFGSAGRREKELSLFQIDVGREWKGGQHQSLYLARELKRKRLPFLFVVQFESPIHEKALEDELPVFPLRTKNGFKLSALFKLSQMMKRKKCLLAHFHDDHSLALGSAAASLAKVRYRVVSRDIYFPLKRGSPSRSRYKKKVDAIIANSEGIKKILIDGSIEPEKIEVIPPGIDFSPFEKDSFKPSKDDYLRRELSLAPDDFLVGVMADLADHKSHRYLIQTTKILKEHSAKIKLIIVGYGPLRMELNEQTRGFPTGDMAFILGFRDNSPEILASLNLFVLSSYQERMKNNVLDAMACRLPVVAAREGGIPDVILPGETGLLVQPRNPLALAKAILKLYSDKDLASILGRRGYELVHRKYSCEAMARKVVALYEKIGLRKWIRFHSRD
jgi:glycosyltransferase involved in cell wall biosynthesis